MKRLAVMTPGMVAFLILAALPPLVWGQADYYHNLERNSQECYDCHTAHFSEGGVMPPGTEAGGPHPMLLKMSTTTVLCLFCHDGTDPTAPDILTPVTMYNTTGDEHSGAGFFANAGGSSSLLAHDLDVTAGTVPFSSLTNVSLGCASCHDPHGTKNYRNLLTAPQGGTGVEALTGTHLFRDQAPSKPPSAGASTSAYKESNIGYKANSSAWCMECHDGLKTNAPGPSRVHHVTDVALNGAGFPTDPAHWTGGAGVGFGTATGDAAEGVPRLRFQVAGASDYTTSRAVAADNQVACLSCHLAHGGPYEATLAWPSLETPAQADKDSGCQQCHNF